MTYTATSLNIQRALKAGLVLHEPLISFPDARRTLFVTPELESQLRGTDRSQGFSAGELAVLIRRFMGGLSLSISQKRRPPKLFKRDTVEFERLEGTDEIWVLCFRKPRPGWRFGGRFLERNVLALSLVEHKDDIGNDYGPFAATVEQDWQARFGAQPPLRGTWIESYMSGTHYDVDQKTTIGIP